MDFKQAAQMVNKALRSMHLDQDTHDSLATAFQIVMQGRPTKAVDDTAKSDKKSDNKPAKK